MLTESQAKLTAGVTMLVIFEINFPSLIFYFQQVPAINSFFVDAPTQISLELMVLFETEFLVLRQLGAGIFYTSSLELWVELFQRDILMSVPSLVSWT